MGFYTFILLEDLADSSDDNIEEDIADIDKLNSSKIDLGIDSLNLEIGTNFYFFTYLIL